MVEIEHSTNVRKRTESFTSRVVRSLPRSEHGWVSDFLENSDNEINDLFENYQFPLNRDLLAWVSWDQMSRQTEGSTFNFREVGLREPWRRLVGKFFEKVTLFDLQRKSSDFVIPGEIMEKPRTPDAFLVRDLERTILVIGSYEFKFGVGDSGKIKERLQYQLNDMKSLDHHFNSNQARKNLTDYIGENKPIIVNPRGYVRRFLVTPHEGHPAVLPGDVEKINIPLTRREVSNLCAASLLDFYQSQKRAKIAI